MPKVEEALEIAEALYEYSILNKNEYVKEKSKQLVRNLVILTEQNNNNKNYTEEIEKVKRKVPKWMKKTHQANYRILKAYMDLSDCNEHSISVEELEEYVDMEKVFLGHYNGLKTISEKNHAKVFEELNKQVELWEPVAEFIEDIFEEKGDKVYMPKYLFQGKIYKKNKKSGDSLGNLLFDIFREYLKDNPNKNYLEIRDIFNPLHKEFSSENSQKKVVLNSDDFYKWLHDEDNNDSKKESRYFGYGQYGNPILHNGEILYFTTQWGNKAGEYGNINTFIDFARDELGYDIRAV